MMLIDSFNHIDDLITSDPGKQFLWYRPALLFRLSLPTVNA